MTHQVVKVVFFILGALSTGLAVLGVVLPFIPATPFLLLATWFFYRSSDKAHHWLTKHRIFGPLITDFRDYRAIRRRSKWMIVIFIWISFVLSWIGFYHSIWLVAGHATGALIGSLVIWKFPTLEDVRRSETATIDPESDENRGR
ncbi:MAG: YbaN family protein [Bacteroidetes bacterium]|nr:YbaN family protein [Bacteroidota bacterium]